MPPMPVIPGVMRVALNWVGSTSALTAANVLHFRTLLGNTADVFAAFDAGLGASNNMWECVADSAKINTVAITPLDGESPTQEFVTGVDAHWFGGSSGEPMPAVAGLVSLKTDARGRSNRGRVYVPFVAESAGASGVMGSGPRTSMQSEWETALDDWVTAGITLVVASYELASARDVQVVTVKSGLATQRRRQTRITDTVA